MEDGSVVQEIGIQHGRVDRAAGAGRSEPREGTTIMPATVARGCATWLHEVARPTVSRLDTMPYYGHLWRLHVVAQPGCMRLHENGIRDGRVDRAAGAERSEPKEGTTIMPAAVRRPRAATETAV